MADINYHLPVVSFDLDDTLFLERDFCRSGFRFLCDPSRYLITDINHYPSPERLQLLISEMDAKLISRENPFEPFERLFRPLILKSGGEWCLRTHIEAYRRHSPHSLHFMEKVEDTLKVLADHGIKMALITDGRSTTQRRKIEALGLEKYIAPELILISDETGHEKKDSNEMFATVVRHFPEAKHFYYVGNNPTKDFFHPNLLGWTTLQVPHHPDEVHEITTPSSPFHAAGITLNSFSDLPSIILR